MRVLGLIFFIPIIALSGCAKKTTYITKPVPVPTPVYSVSLPKSKPGEDTRCSCDQSQAWSAVNNDPSRTRTAKIEGIVKDATLGTIITKTTQDVILGPESSEFLGCTIAQDSVPHCQKINSFRLISEAVVNTASTAEIAAGFPKIFSNDAAVCSKRCQAGGDCLNLGLSGAQLVAPLLALFDASASTPVGTVKMQDVLKKFNLKPEDDACQRGDITVDSISVENNGPSECSIKLSQTLPPETLPVDVRIGVMKDIIASKGSAKSIAPAGSSSQLLAFSDREKGMSIEFNNSKDEIDPDLMNLYGGEVLGAVRIDKQIFIATANGCIAARTK